MEYTRVVFIWRGQGGNGVEIRDPPALKISQEMSDVAGTQMRRQYRVEDLKRQQHSGPCSSLLQLVVAYGTFVACLPATCPPTSRSGGDHLAL